MSSTSFDAEWAGLKEGTAAAAQMRLASAAPDGGGGGGGGGGKDLKSNQAVWNKASSDVGQLISGIKKAQTEFETGQNGATITGVESAAAQRELYQSWKTYLEGLSGKCSALQGPMVEAGKGQAANDEALRADFARMNQQYKDTPATGGDNGGR
ncbi:hypothetical protein [Streptomyces sp. NRRL F-2664]|uniref:hypothetical protein n=1 Tax=Streptomyces sp. NRRL F-2664 TaxID=1463842 RepID=UPI0004C8AE89|nr:hypothetical protein [Streptomyces sp. NRRL F-2664]